MNEESREDFTERLAKAAFSTLFDELCNTPLKLTQVQTICTKTVQAMMREGNK